MQNAPEGSERRLGVFPNPDLTECPVVPLGFVGGKVVFAMPEGEIRQELASKIGTMLRTDIFACQAGAAFLGYWRDSDDKFQRDLASMWFVRKCREAGYWDANRPIRSLGVWPGEAGALILHVGDEVWSLTADGERVERPIVEALRARRGPLYRLRPPAPRPGEAGSALDGQWVRRTLDLWRFAPIGDDGLTGGDVVAGWLMAALLGAVAPFRGHLLVNALAGSGKSTLIEFVHALLSALAGDVVDSFSEAGLRNDLAGMARPVLLDEAEATPGGQGPGVVERALELLRRMSTGSGGTRKQGDVGGGSVTQTAVGAVMLAAINPPRLGPADASRIVEVRLLPLSGSDLPAGTPKPRPVSDGQLAEVMAEAQRLAGGLLARALAGAWRYRSDVGELKAALLRAGESPRAADLTAMLAAGRRLLLFDEPLGPEAADDEAAFWRPLLVQREASEVVSNPGADALAHLMAADAGVFRSDRRQTMGDLIRRWVDGDNDVEDTLKSCGLRLWRGAYGDRPGPWLLVANHHPVLTRIFERTAWAEWRRTLSYVDALGPEFATWPSKPLNYGVGVKQRGLAIPLTPWLESPVRASAGRENGHVPGNVPEQDIEW
ncbi:hypothetical protein [Phenylobacterium sp.]|uniref:hypothetical protein n=1 Tax=Phenylobacterium sp. TaxID=1871053 RepID=UPI0035AD98BB